MSLGTFISDIIECKLATDGCHDNATCADTDGSYTCTCDIGYTGDGFICNSEFLACFTENFTYDNYDF